MLTKKIHGQENASTRIPPSDEADRAAADRDRRPHAHRLRALGALGERRRDDRERRGSDERGTETLQAAADDEDFRARREPVQERRDREDHDADEEDPLAPDEVTGAPAEQQEAAEDERVRVDDPLQVGVRHLEVGLDRRQRDVHDRRVQDHHELRHADQHQHEPRVDVTRAGGLPGGQRVFAHGGRFTLAIGSGLAHAQPVTGSSRATRRLASPRSPTGCCRRDP